MRSAPCLLLLFLLAGCHSVVESPKGDVDRREVYQRIADALPEATFGWGSAPAIASMSASARAEGPAPTPDALKATERGFRIRYEVYRTRTAWIPYKAIKETATSWNAVPNVFFAPLIIVPMQSVRCTVVFDANQVPGMITNIKGDIQRLESISREIGVGGPWSHAQNVKWKMEYDAQQHGPGMLSVHFDFLSGIPAWIPYPGKAKRVAEAFAWARDNHDAPELDPEPEKPAAGDDSAPPPSGSGD